MWLWPVNVPASPNGASITDRGFGLSLLLLLLLPLLFPWWAWASSRCFIIRGRTGGCSRMSIEAHTVLSPCTKNANENER